MGMRIMVLPSDERRRVAYCMGKVQIENTTRQSRFRPLAYRHTAAVKSAAAPKDAAVRTWFQAVHWAR